MTVLQIEHQVQNFERWKIAFESDPIDRQKSGVKSYRVYRPASDPAYVIIDLVFESLEEAEYTLAKLQELWGKVEGKVMSNAKSRILEMVDFKEYE